MTTNIERLGEVVQLATLAPCRVATTANITLSGLQTIDTIALAENDRVLVKDQTSTSENGVYIAGLGGWQRASDFNAGSDITTNVLIAVSLGTGEGLYRGVFTQPVTIGSTDITFNLDQAAALAQIEAASAAATTAQESAEDDATQVATDAAQVAADRVAVAADKAATEDAKDAAFAALAASGNAFTNTTIAAAITAGLAAVADGEFFAATGDDVDYVAVFEDDAGSEVEIYRLAKEARITALELQGAIAVKSDEYGNSSNRASARARTARAQSSKAAVVILTGQSLNAGRGTTFAKQSTGPNARMLVGGAHVSAFDFWGTNETHTMNWTDTASAVEYVEGGEGQSPGVGIASMLFGGSFERVYLCSVAIGARDIGTLSSGGPRVNVYAATQRLCELAIADGYDPHVMYSFRQGEQDGNDATGETDYYTRAKAYLEMLQLCGRQFMGKPDAAVPIVMTYPIQSNNGDDDRAIKEALRRIATDVPNVMARAVYNVPMLGDLVHPTDDGYVHLGEGDGLMLRNFYDNGGATCSDISKLEIIDATWDGSTTGIVYFNEEIANDSGLGIGVDLAGTDGFEWIDNGSAVTISSITYAGRTATLTLATTPSGTTAQQTIRLANQANTPTASVPGNIAGSDVRRAVAAPTSIHDPTFSLETYASPQTFEEVRDA